VNKESCFHFNTLHEAHKFLARFWAAYAKVEEESTVVSSPVDRASIGGNSMAFLTLEG
jgi:hypothetical protein